MANQQVSLKIISVQSRKGGVGKTTFSINLAEHACSRKHPVLFLDFDMTGTEVSEYEKIPMWEKIVNVVRDTKGEKQDLVKLFQSYLSGEAPFKNLSNFSFESEKINVFTSFIHPASSLNHNGIGPAVLFDELHAAWFLSMVRELIDAWIYQYTDRAAPIPIVIIDNAPGYSGLEPELEKWLLDLGPEMGKFVFLASPEPHDIRACLTGMEAIDNAYINRVKVAELYACDPSDIKNASAEEYGKYATQANELLQIKKDKTVGKVKSKSHLDKKERTEFFQRLVESEPSNLESCTYPASLSLTSKHQTCRQSGLCYYRTGQFMRVNKKANLFSTLIINKVVREIHKDENYDKAKSIIYDYVNRIVHKRYPAGSEDRAVVSDKDTEFNLKQLAMLEWIPFDIRYVSVVYESIIDNTDDIATNIRPDVRDLIISASALSFELPQGNKSLHKAVTENIKTSINSGEYLKDIISSLHLYQHQGFNVDFWMDTFYPLDIINEISHVIAKMVQLQVPNRIYSAGAGPIKEDIVKQILTLVPKVTKQQFRKQIIEDISKTKFVETDNIIILNSNLLGKIYVVFAVPIFMTIGSMIQNSKKSNLSMDQLRSIGLLLVRLLVEVECYILQNYPGKSLQINTLEDRLEQPEFWLFPLCRRATLRNAIEGVFGKYSSDKPEWLSKAPTISTKEKQAKDKSISLGKQKNNINKLFQMCCLYYAERGINVGRDTAFLIETIEAIHRLDINNSDMLQQLQGAVQYAIIRRDENTGKRILSFDVARRERDSLLSGVVSMDKFKRVADILYSAMITSYSNEED